MKTKLFATFQFVLLGIILSLPRLPQQVEYHNFADQIFRLGIPNFLDVLTNLIFLFAGAYGFLKIQKALLPATERLFLNTFAFGVLMTSFGSAYYHLEPNNVTLVWDRLPMTIGFVGFFCWLMSVTISQAIAAKFYFPLLIFGFGSVYYWYATEAVGAGDLRPYYLLQFGTILNCLLLLILYYKKPFAKIATWILFTTYVFAKIAEIYDVHIFSATSEFISGHSLKHLSAGLGCLLFFKYQSLATPKKTL